MTRLPKPAQYLLRIDDLCPTVHVVRWERLRQLVVRFGIRPILAVVPANEDRELQASPPDPRFWQQMRELQAAGAAIALHGFSHVCTATGRSLLPLHFTTEFAGMPYQQQRERIGHGLRILRGYGLEPMLFVAPRHGFDKDTLLALQQEGILFLSDGFTRVLHVRGGITWIPMQLWAPLPRARGIWTICLHPNTMDDRHFAELETFLASHAQRFTSIDRLIAEFNGAPLDPFERAYEITATARLRLRRSLNRLRVIAGR